LLKQAEFWTYGPVKQTATQRCVNLEASHEYQLIRDNLGNQILYFTFTDRAPLCRQDYHHQSGPRTVRYTQPRPATPDNIASRNLFSGFIKTDGAPIIYNIVHTV
jgi:hypothetical protein